MPPTAAERTLARRELNRALLARQLLLERAEAPLPRVLERMGGLQAQYAPSMYIGLWTRLEGFTRDQLDEALERRTVVQGTLMRSTIHLVSRRDYWPFALGTRDARRAHWLRTQRAGATEEEMAAAAAAVRARAARGLLTRAELEKLVGKRLIQGINLWVDLLRAPPSGTWKRRRADLFAAAEEWLGPPGTGSDAAMEHVVRRYLQGFGPSTAAEISSWSGIPPRSLSPVLARLDLRRFRGEDGEELLDLPRAPLPPADAPAPVRFLPTFDAILLAHTRSTGILREEHRGRIFNTKTPHSPPTFLVEGEVAGTWRHERGRITVEPFGRLDGATRRALRKEAGRLAELHR